MKILLLINKVSDWLNSAGNLSFNLENKVFLYTVEITLSKNQKKFYYKNFHRIPHSTKTAFYGNITPIIGKSIKTVNIFYGFDKF